jgi:hypothetical protein
MALIINKTNEKPIKFIGSDIELDSVYCRVGFKSFPNGKTLDISVEFFLNKEKFIDGEKLFVDINDANLLINILENETQNLEIAQDYLIEKYTELGYDCSVYFEE